MSKPTNKPGWSSTGVEPSSTKKSQGWAAGEKPSAAQMNWLFKTVSEWIEHVDADQVKGEQGDQGPQGLKGETGDTGPQGLQGLKGQTGDTGAQGSQGLKGDTGDQGPQGLKGDTGDTGSQGAQGLKGDTGDQGPQGEKGLTGDTGPQGSKGLTGDQGPQGAAGGSTLDSAVAARIATLESKARVSTPSSVSAGVPYGGQATSEVNSGSSTINWSSSPSQKIVLSGNTTLTFTNGVSGKVYFLSIQQPSSGSATVTWPGSVSWNGGSAPVLSTTINRKDIVGFYYDGSSYIGYTSASLKGFPVPQSGSETKKGYVAGGIAGSSGSAISSIEKVDFNNDTAFSVIQSQFSSLLNASGTYSSQSQASHVTQGQGTQSSTYGYVTYQSYTSLPTVNGQSTIATTKMSFSTNTVATVRPISTSLWYSTTRRGVIQSADNAYQHNANTALAKMAFATDAFSTVTLSSGIGAALGYSVGMSTSTTGYIWGVSGATNSSYKITFSTEVANLGSTLSAYTSNDAGGWGEAIDGSTAGYVHQVTNTNPIMSGGVLRCYKMLKSTEIWSTLAASLTYSGQGSAATQGNTWGYFCGGQFSTSPGVSGVAYNYVKKVHMSTDLYAAHGYSLNQTRAYAAGFEG